MVAVLLELALEKVLVVVLLVGQTQALMVAQVFQALFLF